MSITESIVSAKKTRIGTLLLKTTPIVKITAASYVIMAGLNVGLLDVFQSSTLDISLTLRDILYMVMNYFLIMFAYVILLLGIFYGLPLPGRR